MLFDFLKLKKALYTLFGVSSVSVSGHYGVIAPILINRKVELIPGSSSPLKRSKSGDLGLGMNGKQFFVEDLENYPNIPSFHNSLRTDQLLDGDFENIGFSENVLTHLNLSKQNTKQLDLGSSLNDGIGRDLKFLERRNYGQKQTSPYAMSDIEIPNKPTAFLRTLHKMSKSDFVQDLIWSLAEESNNNKTIIRPDSIKVDFDIQGPKHLDLRRISDLYPSPARKVYNFLLTFQIFNPNKTKSTILESIPIEPLSESRISISIKKSEIRPYSEPVKFEGFRNKAANWNLNPIDGSEFHVSSRNLFPNSDQRFANLKKLKFIFGRSKFFSDAVTLKSRLSFNTPTFRDFQNEVRTMLSTITEDQIRKDVETWYGAVKAQRIKLLLSDFQKFLNMAKMNNLVDDLGKGSSVVKKFVNNRVFRNNIQEEMHLDGNLKAFINKVLGEKDLTNSDSYQEVMAFINSLEKSFNGIQEHIKVNFDWIQKPKLDNFFQIGNEAYPTVSMKFSTEIELDEKLEIKLVGEEEVDGKQVSFDMSSRTTNLHEIFSLFGKSFPKKILIFDVFDQLIPEAQKYVGWKTLTFEKGTKIKEIYEANKSPITPSLSNDSDSNDLNNRLTVFGWKLLDVSISYDVSSLADVLYQIYSKIDTEKSAWCTLKTLFSCASAALWYKDTPITFLLSFINEYVFEDEKLDKPLKTFFTSLLKEPLKTDSDQMFVGYSGAFFDVDEAFLTELKDKSSSNDKLIFKTTNKDNYEISESNYRFNAAPKTRKLGQIISAFDWNYSTFFPNPATILVGFEHTGLYRNFMNNEGKTSIGLVKNQEKLKELIKKHHYSQERAGETVFPAEKWINWENVKISLVRLKISEAFRTLFSKKLTYNVGQGIFRKLDIDINSFLPELFIRDAFFVMVNFMMAEGTFTLKNFPAKAVASSFRSVQDILVKPNVIVNKIKAKIEDFESKGAWNMLTS